MSFTWLNGEKPSARKIYKMLLNAGIIESIDDIDAALKRARKQATLEPTFSEKISGKSLVEIEKERKKRLKEAWKRREKEAELYGHGE